MFGPLTEMFGLNVNKSHQLSLDASLQKNVFEKEKMFVRYLVGNPLYICRVRAPINQSSLNVNIGKKKQKTHNL